MNYIMRFSEKLVGEKQEHLSFIFLFSNMTASLVIGFLLWLAFKVTIGGTIVALICSMGYSFVFLGGLGGMLYLMNNDLW